MLSRSSRRLHGFPLRSVYTSCQLPVTRPAAGIIQTPRIRHGFATASILCSNSDNAASKPDEPPRGLFSEASKKLDATENDESSESFITPTDEETSSEEKRLKRDRVFSSQAQQSNDGEVVENGEEGDGSGKIFRRSAKSLMMATKRLSLGKKSALPAAEAPPGATKEGEFLVPASVLSTRIVSGPLDEHVVIPTDWRNQRAWFREFREKLQKKEGRKVYSAYMSRLCIRKRDQVRDLETAVILARGQDMELLRWRKITLRRIMEDYLFKILLLNRNDPERFYLPRRLEKYISHAPSEPQPTSLTSHLAGLYKAYGQYKDQEIGGARMDKIVASIWSFLFSRLIKGEETLTKELRLLKADKLSEREQTEKDAEALREQELNRFVEFERQLRENMASENVPETVSNSSSDADAGAEPAPANEEYTDILLGKRLEELNEDFEFTSADVESPSFIDEDALETQRAQDEGSFSNSDISHPDQNSSATTQSTSSLEELNEQATNLAAQPTPSPDQLGFQPDSYVSIWDAMHRKFEGAKSQSNGLNNGNSDRFNDAEKNQRSTGTSFASAKHKLANPAAPLDDSNNYTRVSKGSLTPKSTYVQAMGTENPEDIPNLAHDLSRVLFNPGVYHLRDPRSHTYNFDPWLEKIMPLSEFNFDSLSKFITSSEDKVLQAKAAEERKKYVSSSSSMTGILSHFHFLLSNWRPIKFNVSKDFQGESVNFVAHQRVAAAVFLRYKGGKRYAIDADKEFDTESVLSSLGHVLEKMLTLPREEYERYKKEHENPPTAEESNKGEVYHYTGAGKFLLRSQLDARDPRVNGTGVFDLKTRAVLPIRMSGDNPDRVKGYEIRQNLGSFESYEREYYDMIRATFLKYSLQVRMGNMDGIFVAYHNIIRMFGFQYISLAEMDEAIHNTSNPALGAREFAYSLELIQKILDKATATFPEQSIRLYFETRPGTNFVSGQTFMDIFAVPVTEEQADSIQKKTQSALAKRSRQLAKEMGREDDVSEEATDKPEEFADTEAEPVNTETEPNEEEREGEEDTADDAATKELAAEAGEVELDNPEKMLLMKLEIRNKVNGQYVIRPEGFDMPETKKQSEQWTVEYQLTEANDAGSKANRLLYKRMRARRLRSYMTDNEKEWNSGSPFYKKLRQLAYQGRLHRRQMDRMDEITKIKIYRRVLATDSLKDINTERYKSLLAYRALKDKDTPKGFKRLARASTASEEHDETAEVSVGETEDGVESHSETPQTASSENELTDEEKTALKREKARLKQKARRARARQSKAEALEQEIRAKVVADMKAAAKAKAKAKKQAALEQKQEETGVDETAEEEGTEASDDSAVIEETQSEQKAEKGAEEKKGDLPL